uniref:Uncharacterized protein n=1 Tax=Anopheles albimanus TaxID=7167 RepID=A0A182FUA3_ANOAL
MNPTPTLIRPSTANSPMVMGHHTATAYRPSVQCCIALRPGPHSQTDGRPERTEVSFPRAEPRKPPTDTECCTVVITIFGFVRDGGNASRKLYRNSGTPEVPWEENRDTKNPNNDEKNISNPGPGVPRL